jgi:hypothetical protein
VEEALSSFSNLMAIWRSALRGGEGGWRGWGDEGRLRRVREKGGGKEGRREGGKEGRSERRGKEEGGRTYQREQVVP